MKVAATRLESPPKFEPVTLTITFEHEREIAAFFGVMSHSSICDVLRGAGVNPSDIRDAIKDQYPDVLGTYCAWHSKFCALLK
jgi:hypothetical protein